MKIFSFVLGAGILLAPAARAHIWVVENVQDATCVTLPSDGLSDPADAVEMLREHGHIPSIQEENGPNGKLASVIISYTDSSGESVQSSFFTSMAGCQSQLKQDIADGAVVNPNSLK